MLYSRQRLLQQTYKNKHSVYPHLVHPPARRLTFSYSSDRGSDVFKDPVNESQESRHGKKGSDGTTDRVAKPEIMQM